MISDYPDEDADNFDDDDLLTTYTPPGEPGQGEPGQGEPGQDAPRQDVPRPDDTDRKSGSENAAGMREWPQPYESNSAVRLDAATLAWFTANHVNRQMTAEQVLRAWAATRTDPLPDSQTA
jgi:hypothetical protein